MRRTGMHFLSRGISGPRRGGTSRTQFVFALGLFGALVGLPSETFAQSSSARAKASAISEEAKALFRQGVAAISREKPDYAKGYQAFSQAYAESKSWKILGNLGLCAEHLGKNSEAARFYQTYIDEGASELHPDEVREIEAVIETLKRREDGITLDSYQMARKHFSAGVGLMQAKPPNYQDAYVQFILAYRRSGRDWKVLGNLGFCALQLERDGEAITHYEKYLKDGADQVDSVEREEIDKELVMLRGSLAHLDIEASEEDAYIIVRREGSSAPAQKYNLVHGRARIPVRSGTLIVHAHSRIRKERPQWEVSLNAGESEAHLFDFDAKEKRRLSEEERLRSLVQEAQVQEQQPEERMNLKIPGLISAGVGVLAIGGGVASWFLARGKANDYNAIAATCSGAVTVEDCDQARVDDAQQRYSEAQSFQTLAWGGWIGGGVLIAAGAGLYSAEVLHERKAGRDQAWRVTPLVSPQMAGATFRGSF